MRVVFLFLLLIFELIQQAALVNFILFLNILKILKISFLTCWRKNSISLALGALFSSQTCQTSRIALCKQPQLVKPCLIFQIQNLWHGFTRGNSFLQTHSHCISRKSENPPPSAFRHINNSFNVYLFFDSKLQPGKSKEFNNEVMKLRVKWAFKSYFCH